MPCDIDYNSESFQSSSITDFPIELFFSRVIILQSMLLLEENFLFIDPRKLRFLSFFCFLRLIDSFCLFNSSLKSSSRSASSYSRRSLSASSLLPKFFNMKSRQDLLLLQQIIEHSSSQIVIFLVSSSSLNIFIMSQPSSPSFSSFNCFQVQLLYKFILKLDSSSSN